MQLLILLFCEEVKRVNNSLLGDTGCVALLEWSQPDLCICTFIQFSTIVVVDWTLDWMFRSSSHSWSWYLINSLAWRRNKHDYCTSCLLVPNRVPFPFFSLKKENEKEKCVAHNIIPASIRCLACNTVNILDGIMDMIVEFFTSNRPLISPTHVGHIRYENINMMYVVYHFLVISNYGDINYFKGCMYCHTNQPPKYLCILFGFIHISNYTTSLVPRW